MVGRCGLEGTMPALAGLLCASPVDAALHDAFGVVNGIDVYAGYGREFMGSDLSRYLGPKLKGKYPGDYVTALSPWVEVAHRVGCDEPLTDGEAKVSARDGYPMSLAGWIGSDGVRLLKVQIEGSDAGADARRLLEVARVAREALGARGTVEMGLAVECDGRCAGPGHVEIGRAHV